MLRFRLEKIDRPSPAKVNKRTKIITIDPDRFRAIKSYNVRVFILCHELAHLKKQDSQVEADRLAFQMYYRKGYPLRDVIFALTGLVSKEEAKRRVSYLCNYLLG